MYATINRNLSGQLNQWKKYNNRNYCWPHEYHTSNLHTSGTWTRKNVGQEKESTQGYPMGGSQHNKSHVWKKVWKIFGGDNKKQSTVKLNSKTYNGTENTYVCSNLAQAPTKQRQNKKEENYAVSDSGCTGNFMTVSDHLDNLRCKTNIINAKFPNRKIIRYTMEGELYLTMLPSTSIQAHIPPKINY